MAYFSLHAYDADLWIPAFRGLNQADTGMNPDPQYAAAAENVETPDGVLQPAAGTSLMDGEFESRVETLAAFTRRWYTGKGSNEWYVCCAGGKLYQRQRGSSNDWDEITLPTGVSAYQESTWSYVTYEINPENTDYTVDVVLMSNNVDGMIMIVPPDKPRTYGDLEVFTHEALAEMTHKRIASKAWQVQPVNTQGYKFGVIERFAERIWGGDVAGQPDLLVYSAPYNPTDWEQNAEIPEDGAGEVRQPSWDGDRFHALKRFGDQLLAFKRNRVWRVMGTNPGEYVFSEQYGGGTAYFGTIAADGERLYMLSADGASVYDGMTVSEYAREQVQDIWRTVNREALDRARAVMFRHKYYAALPVNGSSVNNALLVYDMREGTILYHTDAYIENFMTSEDELFMTSSNLPGRILKAEFDSWQTGVSSGKATKWISNWIDFGYKRIVKGGFDVYFIPEVQGEAVTLRFSIQTEKKTKTKEYTVQPLTEEQRERNREHRGKRLHFSGTGRRFRLVIETDAGSTAPWRLTGGIQMVVETDPD